MSKYRERGAYHYRHYATKGDPYREHVRLIVQTVNGIVDGRGWSIADLGCGEGLVVDLLSLTHGDRAFGIELDDHAVNLARDLNNYVIAGDLCDCQDTAEVVLLLDVLEHVERWREAIAAAKRHALFIIVALPDRPDPHACNTSPEFYLDVVDEVEKNSSLKMVHEERRHARRVLVFQHLETSE